MIDEGSEAKPSLVGIEMKREIGEVPAAVEIGSDAARQQVEREANEVIGQASLSVDDFLKETRSSIQVAGERAGIVLSPEDRVAADELDGQVAQASLELQREISLITGSEKMAGGAGQAAKEKKEAPISLEQKITELKQRAQELSHGVRKRMEDLQAQTSDWGGADQPSYKKIIHDYLQQAAKTMIRKVTASEGRPLLVEEISQAVDQVFTNFEQKVERVKVFEASPDEKRADKKELLRLVAVAKGGVERKPELMSGDQLKVSFARADMSWEQLANSEMNGE